MRNTWRWFAWYVWDKCQGTPGNARGRLAPCHEWLLHFNTTPREANKTIAKLPQSIKFRPTSGGGRTRHGKRTYSSTPLSNLHPFKIPDSVIRVNPRDNKTGTNHPAIFPVPLPATLIEAFTDAGQLVFDPFAGAATTIVAADRTGRIGYGVELSPAYADQALHRLRRETGIIPRDQDGRSFDPQFFA